jgi:hypothetical protein
MWQDEIVEETRQRREEYTSRFQYNLEAIANDLKIKESQSERRLTSLPPRRPVRKHRIPQQSAPHS